MITLSSKYLLRIVHLLHRFPSTISNQSLTFPSSNSYRQKVVVRSAARSARIVHSLYPQFVRDSLMSSRKDLRDPIEAANTDSTQQYDPEDPSYRRKGSIKSKVSDFVDTPGMQLKRFLSHPTSSRDYDYNLCMEIGEMEPIAEIFEKTTVMLADIEGFTAWW